MDDTCRLEYEEKLFCLFLRLHHDFNIKIIRRRHELSIEIYFVLITIVLGMPLNILLWTM